MQNPKISSSVLPFSSSWSRSSEVAQKTSPTTPRAPRQARSDSGSVTRTPTEGSPKLADRRSPRSPASELQKKRTARVSDLENQLVQAQQELKKTKEVLSSAESCRRRALQEAEEAKKQCLAMASKLEEKHRELLELSASEESRIHELRKLSQERNRAWQSELDAVQRQSSVDSAALSAAMNEIQKLRLQAGAQEAMYQRKAEATAKALSSELERMNSVLEEAEMIILEGQVLRTVEIFSAHEFAERVMADSDLREAELRASLTEKEAEIRRVKEEDDGGERRAELRRLRIQAEQWKKAAEAAAAILSAGNQGSTYTHISPRLMSSPCDDDLEEGSPRRKNVVLRKLGVFWKKGQK